MVMVIVAWLGCYGYCPLGRAGATFACRYEEEVGVDDDLGLDYTKRMVDVKARQLYVNFCRHPHPGISNLVTEWVPKSKFYIWCLTYFLLRFVKCYIFLTFV